MQLFALGLAFNNGDVVEDPMKMEHISARFLVDYFASDSPTISQLCDVTASQINKITPRDHAHLIKTCPSKPPPMPSPDLLFPGWNFKFDPDHSQYDSGRVSISPGKMWYPTNEEPHSPSYEPYIEVLDWELPTISAPALPATPIPDLPAAFHESEDEHVEKK